MQKVACDDVQQYDEDDMIAEYALEDFTGTEFFKLSRHNDTHYAESGTPRAMLKKVVVRFVESPLPVAHHTRKDGEGTGTNLGHRLVRVEELREKAEAKYRKAEHLAVFGSIPF